MSEIAARSDKGCEVAVTSSCCLFGAWQSGFSFAPPGLLASVLLPLACAGFETGFDGFIPAYSCRKIVQETFSTRANGGAILGALR